MLAVLYNISDFLWGWPLIVIIVAVSLTFSFQLRFIQFTKLGWILKNTLFKMFERRTEGEGNLTPFQAACAALSATIGVGNIAGVGMAIGLGGPGAVFWMWVVALFAMINKYAEIVLGLTYRVKDPETGIYRGGGMYYISRGLGERWRWLAFVFALMFAFMFFVFGFVQSNTLAITLKSSFGIPTLAGGILVAFFVGIVVIGGVKRLGEVAEKVVPIMAFLYALGALIIIFMNISRIPEVFTQIFRDAFTGAAAAGGFAGSTAMLAIRHGFARGIFSNEGGMGSAPVAHSTAAVNHPVRQGIWGVFEVFLDTIVVCSATALVIMFTGVLPSGKLGSELTQLAFNTGLPVMGNVIVTVGIILFAYTTALTNEFYCETGVAYALGNKAALVVRYLYILGLIYGAVGGLQQIWGLADFFMAIVVIINLLVIFSLRQKVWEATYDFFWRKPGEPRKLKWSGTPRE
ncbi:MAG: alanine or glycine:cation symporter, family [Bacillota bacterium]|jgi:AGCS family alanine or glycine:cation symporter|nr:alanine or glycine:cation symporter, family [Bacillota bacterium]